MEQWSRRVGTVIHLAAPTPPPRAETRIFAPLGATTLLENLAREQRLEVPHRKRIRTHKARPHSMTAKKLRDPESKTLTSS